MRIIILHKVRDNSSIIILIVKAADIRSAAFCVVGLCVVVECIDCNAIEFIPFFGEIENNYYYIL